MLPEHADLLRCLGDALSAVGSVDALEEPVSPYTRAQYARMLAEANQYSGQILAQVRMLGTVSAEYIGEDVQDDGSGDWEILQNPLAADDIEDELEVESELGAERVAELNAELDAELQDLPPDEESDSNEEDKSEVRARVERLWPRYLWLKMRPSDFVDLLLQEEKLSRSKAEDAALARLLVGYSNPSQEALKHMLQGAMDNMEPWNDVIALSDEIDAEGDVKRRLFKREEFMYQNNAGTRLSTHAMTVIQIINNLKFALDWRQVSAHWKTTFVTQIFEVLKANEITDITRKWGGTMRNKEMKKLRRTFGKWHQKIVTDRNHVLKIYHMFGAGVLLDTTWAPNPRSRYFGATLNRVFITLQSKIAEDGSGYDSIQQYKRRMKRSSRSILKTLLEAADWNNVWEFVENFLNDAENEADGEGTDTDADEPDGEEEEA
ncbi:hypothetical protein D9615_005844 [Tricholomella constricta]|uniref:Uncharacterized protein n=1 Tax=Tricholomella constricta TaxID=117010 RepID=A0A8H5HAR2_9AGAR|nr:hypothetical protein D9615_005844 [Tricholomella constricta]